MKNLQRNNGEHRHDVNYQNYDGLLKSVTDIVSDLVKDTALAAQVNDAVTAKWSTQRDEFVRSNDKIEFASK